MSCKTCALRWGMLLLAVIMPLVDGCASKPQRSAPTDNRRKQVQLQSHLRKLNRENEKLRDLVVDASEVNKETGRVIRNNLANPDKLPKLQQALDEFKKTHQETDKILLDYQRALEKDVEKNRTLDEMLNGFADECESQEDKKRRMKDMVKAPKEDKPKLHFGLSGLRVTGLFKADSVDDKYAFNGYSGALYLTYVSDGALAIGLRRIEWHTTSSADAASDSFDADFESSPEIKYKAEINAVTLGFRIRGTDSLSVIPQFIYGIGSNSVTDVEMDESVKGGATLQGFELPIDCNFSPGLSFGFLIGYYQLSSQFDEYKDDYISASLDGEVAATSSYVALGINIGGAF